MGNYRQLKMITKELLMLAGKNKGLVNKEYIEKDYFQDLLLYEIFQKTNKLIFKGGTALYKLYGLRRFSEDLDFSIKEISKEEAIKIIKQIVEKSEIFKIKSIKETKESVMIKLACRGILTSYNTLRIDLNFKNKILINEESKIYTSSFPDIPQFLLKCIQIQEIIAEKVHSIFNRKKARDLYDLFFLLKIAKPNIDFINQKFEIFSIKYEKDSFKRRIEDLKSLWNPELDPFVLEALPEFNEVKNFVLSKF